MLELPPAWNRCSTAYTVKHLLRQADDRGRYAEGARAFAKAAIDFMIAGPRWDHQRSSVRLKRRKHGWQINDWVMHILPATSDEAFFEAVELANRSPRIDILAPPWSALLVEQAIRTAVPDDRTDVIGLDMFCEYRTHFTGIDLNWPHPQTLLDLLTRYRRLTQSISAITLPLINDWPPD